MSLTDFDPTNGGGNWLAGAGSGAATGAMIGGPVGAAIGGGIGLVAGGLQDLTGGAARRRRARAEAEARRRQEYYDQLGREYRAVPDDPNTTRRAGAIFDPMGKEIDRGMYQATRGIAGGMSRRGITGGYSMAGQASAVQRAADERARGRAAALDQAIGEGRQGIYGQASLSHPGDNFISQMLSGANSEEAAATARASDFQDNAYESALSAAGRYFGTPKMNADPGFAGGVESPQPITPEEEAVYRALISGRLSGAGESGMRGAPFNDADPWTWSPGFGG